MVEYLLSRHRSVWAIDFFTVETALLKTIYVFVVMEVHSRRLISLQTTTHPTPIWVANILRSEFVAESDSPDLVLRDRDIKEVLTPAQSPKANCYVERLIGSIRPHQGIDQAAPGHTRLSCQPNLIGTPRVILAPQVLGLHRSYSVTA